jgi:uncharacterized protein (TIGR03382 family)
VFRGRACGGCDSNGPDGAVAFAGLVAGLAALRRRRS